MQSDAMADFIPTAVAPIEWMSIFPNFHEIKFLSLLSASTLATSFHSLQCHVLELKSESSSACCGWMWAPRNRGRKEAGSLSVVLCFSHSMANGNGFFHTAGLAAYPIFTIYGSNFKKLIPILYFPNRISRVRFLVRNGSWKFRLVYLCFIFKSYLFFSLLN